MQREISKLPEVPPLNEKIIKSLTELCFRHDSHLGITPSDAVFVFGTAVSLDKEAEAVLDVIRKVSPKKLIMSGGMPTYSDSYKATKPESEMLYDLIHEFLPKELEVRLEKASNNCIENVQNSLLYFQNMESITYVTKGFGAGRHYYTLKRFLPNIMYQQKTFDALYPEDPSYITRDNWYTNSYGLSRVWGEFLRIITYGQRGDIAYDEARSLVEKIMVDMKRDA